MAGKYSRVDGRKSSSNLCSSILVSAFVGVCLLAAWLLSASSVIPITNLEVSGEVKDDVKTPVTKDNVGSASDVSIGIDHSAGDSKEEESQKQFEDNPGDLPEDASKGDANVSLNQEDKSATSEEISVEKQELVNTDDDKKMNEEEKESGFKDESESREEIKDNEDSQVENNQVNEDGEKGEGQIEEKSDSSEDDKSDQGSVEKDGNSVDAFPSGPQSELSDEPSTQKRSFPTQATESKKERKSNRHPNLKARIVLHGNFAIPLLGQITSHALIIWWQFEIFQQLSTMSTGRGTVLKSLQLALCSSS